MCKKYCKDCLRYYCTNANQCNIPNAGFLKCGDIKNNEVIDDIMYDDINKKHKAYGLEIKNIDKEKMEFVSSHMSNIFFENAKGSKIYGKPSELNINNDCVFYKALPKHLRLLTNFCRMFY